MPEILELPRKSPLAENTIIVNVGLSRLGNRKKLSNSLITVDAEKDAISASKELLESEELKKVASLDVEIRKYIKNRCLPSHFQDGMYLVPRNAIDEVEAKLTIFKQQRQQLVNDFVSIYPIRVREARARLRAAYNERDYPNVEYIRTAFKFRWNYYNIDTPVALSTINKDLYDRQREEINEKWAEAEREIVILLREGAKELVSHLAESLTPDKEGKRKRFYASSLENLREFIDNFQSRNVLGDGELDEIIAQLRQMTEGIDAAELRENDSTANIFRVGFKSMKNEINNLLEEDKPVRRRNFNKDY